MTRPIHGALIQSILDYLFQNEQGTVRQITHGGSRQLRRSNVGNCLKLHPELFEEIGEVRGVTVWGLKGR